MDKPAPTPRCVLLAVVALIALVYLGDFAWFELRAHIPSLGPAQSSVHRIRLLAIAGKANKVEYRLDALKPEEDLPCSLSLFPQPGMNPCWYVRRHADDPIPM